MYKHFYTLCKRNNFFFLKILVGLRIKFERLCMHIFEPYFYSSCHQFLILHKLF